MSDSLALANAIEDAGIERSKAERVASVIFNTIHDNVATKADVQDAEAKIRSEIAANGAATRAELKQAIAGMGGNLTGQIVALRTDLSGQIGELRTNSTSLRGDMALLEHRLLIRLGGLVIVMTGIILAALRYWPSRHGG